jgi:hypothetical protein
VNEGSWVEGLGLWDLRYRKNRKMMAEVMVLPTVPNMNGDVFLGMGQSCRVCGRYGQTGCDELPERCWRPVGVILVWDNEVVR